MFSNSTRSKRSRSKKISLFLAIRIKVSKNITDDTGCTQDTSRNNSLSHRRSSIAQAQALEEKRLAKRIVDLEAELQSYKDEVASRKNSNAEFQKQVEEATLTKKDLKL